MKSGNVIPFAVLEDSFNSGLSFKKEWDEKGHRLISFKAKFIKYGEIERVNFISGSEVESITVDKEIKLTWFRKWWNGSM